MLRSEHQFDPLFAFFINLTNPAVILLFSVLFSYFHINLLVHSSYEVYVFLFGLLIGSLSWWVFLSSIIIYLRKYVKDDILLYVHKISGVLLMLFALIIFLSFIWGFIFPLHLNFGDNISQSFMYIKKGLHYL